MAWGSKTQIASGVSATSTETYSSAITLNPRELAHVQVKADFPTSPTDHLEVSVYTTLDDSSETWDDVPIYAFQISNTSDPSVASIQLSGLYKFRLGFKATGSTDTITVDAWVRKDGVSA